MKVLSTKPDGSALVELDLKQIQYSSEKGVHFVPIQLEVDIKDIPDLLQIGRAGHRAGQKLSSMMNRAKHVWEKPMVVLRVTTEEHLSNE